MPVKFWQRSIRFWFLLSYLITTVKLHEVVKIFVKIQTSLAEEVTTKFGIFPHRFKLHKLFYPTNEPDWRIWAYELNFIHYLPGNIRINTFFVLAQIIVILIVFLVWAEFDEFFCWIIFWPFKLGFNLNLYFQSVPLSDLNKHLKVFL